MVEPYDKSSETYHWRRNLSYWFNWHGFRGRAFPTLNQLQQLNLQTVRTLAILL